VEAGEDRGGPGSSRSRSPASSLAVAPRSAMAPRRRPWMRRREQGSRPPLESSLPPPVGEPRRVGRGDRRAHREQGAGRIRSAASAMARHASSAAQPRVAWRDKGNRHGRARAAFARV
jgi:hypothetical protein